MVFAFKWGVRKGKTTVQAVPMNFRAPADNYPKSSFASVKLAWLPKDWGLPEVYDRSSEKDCRDIVQEKLDEDVGSFKASLLPHWKEAFRKEWTQCAGDIDDERDLFTWMFSKTKFFVSAAAVESWINVRLYTGFCL